MELQIPRPWRYHVLPSHNIPVLNVCKEICANYYLSDILPIKMYLEDRWALELDLIFLHLDIIQNSLGQENPINLEALLSEYLVNPNHLPSNEVSNNLLPQRVSSFPGMSNGLIVDSISDSSFHSQRQITQSTMNHEFPAFTEACLEERFGVSNSNTSEVPCFDFAPIYSQTLEGIFKQVPPDRDLSLPPLPEIFVETLDNGAGFNLYQYDQTAHNLLSHVCPTNLEVSLSANLADPNHQLSTDVSDNLLSQRLTGSNFYSQRLMTEITTSHEFPSTSETWRPIDVDRSWEGVSNYMPFQQDSNLLVPSPWENTNMQGLGHAQTYNMDFNFVSSHNQATLGSLGPENVTGAGSFADDPYINSNSR